jgi:lysophospholipase L1-like esterase
MVGPVARGLGGTLALVSLALLGAACGNSSSSSTSTITSTTVSPRQPAKVDYYVSLGDSYAAGYQPSGPHVGSTGTNGFAYQVVTLAAHKGYHYTLVNFGCGGATTTSILGTPGCRQLGPGAPAYPDQTQAAAAEAFLRAHRGQVGLITVSIGGNDVTACAYAASPVNCVQAAVSTIQKNVGALVAGLRAAAGPTVPIVGTTYPDVILGLDVAGGASERQLAGLSVIAFKDLINPTLSKAYASVGGKFVDVTAATGAYGSLSDKTDLAPYGEIPVPVAKVCELTFYCQYHDIHPRTAGYTIIAQLVVGTLPPHP